MAQHRVLPPALGRTHHINRTPHMAVTVYMAIVVSVPVVLEVFTDPLTIFGDAGTLAAFGFLLAYFLITVAAPVYLKKTGQLRRSDLVMAVAAFVLLLVPTEGSFYPVPAWPVDLFPYIFVAYVAVGAVWLYVAARRRPGILGEIAADLEAKEPQSATVIAPIEDPLTVAAVTRAPASGLEPAV
jgi:amino acid transporter